MSFSNNNVENTIEELHLAHSKINTIRQQIKEELDYLSKIKDVTISDETTQMVQKESNGVKQFKDAAKKIPEMEKEIISKKVEPPKGLDGKNIPNTKRLEIYNYHKTKVDSILLKVNSLESS